ncbi:hypothetical protein RQP46_009046 [Phenoliferia psychrophenolica]
MASRPKATTGTDVAVTVKRTERLQSLWAGYGTISRLHLSDRSSLILKTIVPPSLSGGFDESNARKLTSYDVERFFYSDLAPSLPPTVRIAKSFPLRDGMNLKENLLLEDLDEEFDVDGAGSYVSLVETHAVLTWLAKFHATFSPPPPSIPLHPPPSSSSPSTPTAGIWRYGNYWHLATRSSEFASLSSSHYLRLWAPYVDSLLSDPNQPGRTILHGDAKSANIAFARNPSSSSSPSVCVLYDFQYCGTGLGVQDVIYFLSTSVSPSSLAGAGYEDLLRVYWEAAGAIQGWSWEVCKEQAEWAIVDWARFLDSWGQWGNARWVDARAKEIVARWRKDGVVP